MKLSGKVFDFLRCVDGTLMPLIFMIEDDYQARCIVEYQ